MKRNFFYNFLRCHSVLYGSFLLFYKKLIAFLFYSRVNFLSEKLKSLESYLYDIFNNKGNEKKNTDLLKQPGKFIEIDEKKLELNKNNKRKILYEDLIKDVFVVKKQMKN